MHKMQHTTHQLWAECKFFLQVCTLLEPDWMGTHGQPQPVVGIQPAHYGHGNSGHGNRIGPPLAGGHDITSQRAYTPTHKRPFTELLSREAAPPTQPPLLSTSGLDAMGSCVCVCISLPTALQGSATDTHTTSQPQPRLLCSAVIVAAVWLTIHTDGRTGLGSDSACTARQATLPDRRRHQQKALAVAAGPPHPKESAELTVQTPHQVHNSSTSAPCFSPLSTFN